MHRIPSLLPLPRFLVSSFPSRPPTMIIAITTMHFLFFFIDGTVCELRHREEIRVSCLAGNHSPHFPVSGSTQAVSKGESPNSTHSRTAVLARTREGGGGAKYLCHTLRASAFSYRLTLNVSSPPYDVNSWLSITRFIVCV